MQGFNFHHFIIMPKAIELTVQVEIQRVSCPGVWLCQDGAVFLTVSALGSKFETNPLPPIFPLNYNEVFLFSKMYLKTSSLKGVCAAMRDETIFCELVQQMSSCPQYGDKHVILAHYLGALEDILFIPDHCSEDGIDLLMRRTSDYPGILAPKIEIRTKVRIDEVIVKSEIASEEKEVECVTNLQRQAVPPHDDRQRKVCHTPTYHRSRCPTRSPSPLRDRRRYNKLRTTLLNEFRPPPERIVYESRYIVSPVSCNVTCYDTPSDRGDKRIHEGYGGSECCCDICTRYNEKFLNSTIY